jgi:hypothetical protein
MGVHDDGPRPQAQRAHRLRFWQSPDASVGLTI